MAAVPLTPEGTHQGTKGDGVWEQEGLWPSPEDRGQAGAWEKVTMG